MSTVLIDDNALILKLCGRTEHIWCKRFAQVRRKR